jgi:hypothetical protein
MNGLRDLFSDPAVAWPPLLPPAVTDDPLMARDVITLSEVAGRGAEMIEIRCGHCDRAGRLSVARLLAEYGPDAAMGHVLRAQVGDCPNNDSDQAHKRCDPYCPDLPGLFLNSTRSPPA